MTTKHPVLESVKRDESRRLRAEVFKRLALDSSIPHGAVRLFLVLYTYSKNGRCWPGQRTLQRDLHCQMNSIKPWVEKLQRNGYLTTTQTITNKGTITIYTLNLGRPLPEPVTGGVTGFKGGVTGFKGGVTGTGNEIISTELSPLNQGKGDLGTPIPQPSPGHFQKQVGKPW